MGQGIQPKTDAAALQYLQEHHLTDYAALTARTELLWITFTSCLTSSAQRRKLFQTSELMLADVDYARRPLVR